MDATAENPVATLGPDCRLAWLDLYSGTNGTWTGMVTQASHTTNFVGNGQTNYVGGVLEPPTSNGIISVEALMLDLDGDFNHDGSVNETDPDDPDEHTPPGLVVPANTNGMVKVHLALYPPTVNSGEVVLGAPTSGRGRIRVWKDPARGSGNLILDSGDLENWKKTWVLSPSFTFADLATDLYVEGVTNSGAYGDISLVLR